MIYHLPKIGVDGSVAKVLDCNVQGSNRLRENGQFLTHWIKSHMCRNAQVNRRVKWIIKRTIQHRFIYNTMFWIPISKMSLSIKHYLISFYTLLCLFPTDQRSVGGICPDRVRSWNSSVQGDYYKQQLPVQDRILSVLY